MNKPKTWRYLMRPLRESWRFIILGVHEPVVLPILLSSLAVYPFGGRCRKSIPEEITAAREKSVAAGTTIGWADTARVYAIEIRGRKLMEFTVRSEIAQHILNFYYFRRSSFILENLAEFTSKGLEPRLFEGMRIFEPGCNMGRMLLMLKDLYGAKVTGADISVPSIQMAKIIGGRNSEFRNENVLESAWLRSLPDNHFDLIIASSFINHVTHLPAFPAFLRELRRVSRQIYIHDRPLDHPEALAKIIKDESALILERQNEFVLFSKKDNEKQR